MPKHAVIIGAGPSGLMAAEVLGSAGHRVDVFDGMASPGRKFLRAGVGGLNLTKDQDPEAFLNAYGPNQAARNWLQPFLQNFGQDEVRSWADGLGAETFVGSSGKVFPKAMKAAPLLRAWLNRLSQLNVTLHLSHTWTGWTADSDLSFQSNHGTKTTSPDITILALGGASWPRLGSTGTWTDFLIEQGITCSLWQPSNCGFEVHWSDFLKQRRAGTTLPTVEISCSGRTIRSPLTISDYGLEGHGIYALSADLREAIARDGHATLLVDLAPDRDLKNVQKCLSKPQGSRSFSNHLKRCLGFDTAYTALLHESDRNIANRPVAEIAQRIKATPIICQKPRPIAEAISSAGGVALSELQPTLALTKMPTVFCAGEMLDWDAPTGGYLLTACLSLGHHAGKYAAQQAAQHTNV